MHLNYLIIVLIQRLHPQELHFRDCEMKLVVLLCLLIIGQVANEEIHRKFFLDVCLSAIRCDHFNLVDNWLKNFDPLEDVKFVLRSKTGRSRKYSVKRIKRMLKKTDFDRAKPTKILVHGYLNSHGSFINNLIGNVYSEQHEVNVVKGKKKEF